MKAALALALMIGSPAAFQPATLHAQADARVADLRPDSGNRWVLHTATRTAQTILFPDGEQILDVSITAPLAYRSGITATGDSLILVPSSEIEAADMVVETEAAIYEFDLVPVPSSEAPLVIRIGQAGDELFPPATEHEVPPDTGQYRLSGDQVLRPAAISDDGSKTYIRWHAAQAMPAVFGIGPSGDEEMVDGHMRGEVFTIDRVYAELVFRIDKERARAKRRDEGARQ